MWAHYRQSLIKFVIFSSRVVVALEHQAFEPRNWLKVYKIKCVASAMDDLGKI